MKLVAAIELIAAGPFAKSAEWRNIRAEIVGAIRAVVWPPGSKKFILHDSKGRGRGQGNGVKPIKEACMLALKKAGWDINERSNWHRLDATRKLKNGLLFGLEWETGNISSSHRSMNRMLLGYAKGILGGGILIVPTRKMYRYLTDRVGNLTELEPYFDLWRSMKWKEGILAIMAVEHDGVSKNAPRIQKGPDGRALI